MATPPFPQGSLERRTRFERRLMLTMIHEQELARLRAPARTAPASATPEERPASHSEDRETPRRYMQAGA